MSFDPAEPAETTSASVPSDSHVATMSNPPGPVTVFGATGSIGSATLASLRRSSIDCTAVTRALSTQSPSRLRYSQGDLLDPSSISRSLDGADTVVHTASYTGSDPRRCDEINRVGTLNLLEAAASHGISSVLYVSTIGVYGLGPHRNVTERDGAAAPETPVSASRRAAEIAVLEFGGTVVRPAFVYGTGDRWLFPGVRSITGRLGGLVDEGRARTSVVDIGDLADAVAALVRKGLAGPRVFNAAEPNPPTLRDIAVAAGVDTASSMGLATAIDRADELGVRAREIDLVGRDHWYCGDLLWTTIGSMPSRAFPRSFAKSVGT